MKKIIYFLVIVLCSTTIIASEGLGIVSDEDFLKVGVTSENVEKAKMMVNRVSTNYKMLILEKKQLELEVNKYVLEGPEANLEKIDAIFDKIGAIEASILKDRIRSQIEMQKYITQEQYLKARDIAIKRLNTPK
ncbi:hypothetical protein [Fusobacterium mortiferum]|jgi:hypothetical protein|uniref:Uncharacterized protein n=2 Tax=Fusobacterium TaxID=848 RepID=A0ABS2FYF5_FUSMR|nr:MULTISPECIES: hypothetical protein [Fusobacterium]MBM6690517.1 hypothetical protein [Fusobacterium mortiferum]MBM6874186.1 hypothetical protein [Fusobacterium mortiferum]MBU3842440.1 hypothetical protein [Candidatus Fusobacterium pullicola]MDO5789084.1 hypothetical protein [Fusobacterium sp.]